MANDSFSEPRPYPGEKGERQQWVHDTERYVRVELLGEGSGHDWWHVERVWKNARHITQEESVDMTTVELAALLHNIADYKLHGGDDTLGSKVAHEWLNTVGAGDTTTAHVCEIVQTLSFKGAETLSPMRTREGMVVQDADRPDRIKPIGAIGIARAFAYGGYTEREIHNPEISPARHVSFEEYMKNGSPTINHFYEKLLLLKDRMNTQTARHIADERHRFMEAFLEQFYREWRGEA
jgi:uncharacterized protein